MDESKFHDEHGKGDMDKSDAEVIKNMYDKRIYELDLFKSILSKIIGFDYRYPKTKANKESDLEKTTDAGSIGEEDSTQLTPDKEEEDITVTTIRQLEVMLTKKCKKCFTIKAPKSHHCSICKRCVARMDHHCPWVNNCVGYYN